MRAEKTIIEATDAFNVQIEKAVEREKEKCSSGDQKQLKQGIKKFSERLIYSSVKGRARPG